MVREGNGFSSPERSDCLDVPEHPLLAVWVVVGREDEVVRLPSGRRRDPDAPSREIVHHRPLLGHPDRVVERQHDAPAPDLDAVRDRSERCTGHCGVWVEAAEGMEVALGR